jgi:hypothetical protein
VRLADLLLMVGGGASFLEEDMPFSGALVTRSTDQSVTNDTFPVITFDTEEYDTDAYWDPGAGDRFTIPADGIYQFGVVVRWKATNNPAGAGVRGCGVWINGEDPATLQDIGYNEWPSSELTGALMHQTPVGPPRALSAGDYIRAHAYQYSTGGSALDVHASQSRTPAFWIVRLRVGIP